MGRIARFFNFDQSDGDVAHPIVTATLSTTERVSVVGESHYQAALREACGAGATGDIDFDCLAELVPEPDNAHDPNAVMVQVGSQCVGYLSRGDAMRFGPIVKSMLERGHPTICTAFIGRKEDTGNPNLGICLDVPAQR